MGLIRWRRLRTAWSGMFMRIFRGLWLACSFVRTRTILFCPPLGLRQLLRRQFGFDFCHLLMGSGMPFFHGEQIPGISLHLIFFNPMTVAIHGPQHIIGVSAALLRGLAKPAHGLFAVLRQMISAVEHRAQGHLGIHRFEFRSGHPDFSKAITDANHACRKICAAAYAPSIPIHRARAADRDAVIPRRMFGPAVLRSVVAVVGITRRAMRR